MDKKGKHEPEPVALCDICVGAELSTAIPWRECTSCQLKACRNCLETYFLGCKKAPHCMKCQIEWSTESFLSMKWSCRFRKEYKKKRKTELFLHEKLFFEETMPIMSMLEEQEQIRKMIGDTHAEWNRISRQLSRYERRLQFLQEQCSFKHSRSSSSSQSEKKMVIPCPVSECRGICIDGRCPLCKMDICLRCHQKKGGQRGSTTSSISGEATDVENNDEEDQHVCDSSHLMSIAKIQKECRSCPQCSVYIFKIDGCDQMWCTQCNIAFSWKTGEVERGRIHNPHFIEFLNQMTDEQARKYEQQHQNLGRRMCRDGGAPEMPSLFEIRTYLRTELTKPFRETVYETVRLITHILQEEKHRFQLARRQTREGGMVDRAGTGPDNGARATVALHGFNTYGPLRVQYLSKQLSQAEFENRLFREEKKKMKFMELWQIIDAFQLMVSSLFRVFVNERSISPERWKEFIDIVFFFHEQFQRNLKLFQSKMHNPFSTLKHFLSCHISDSLMKDSSIEYITLD